MSDGAPCEQGISQGWSTSLLGQEVPECVPDGGRIKISSKKVWWECYQHNRQLQQEAVASTERVQAQVDRAGL